MKRKLNPPDATTRNVKASNRRDAKLAERVSRLERALTAYLPNWRKMAGAGAILVLLLTSGASVACVHPPPTYSTQGTRAFNADQLIQQLTALSQTAVNLNAQQGALHLGDADVRFVRDFALSAGAALNDYGSTPSGTTAAVKAALMTLQRQLSSESKLNPSFLTALNVVVAAVNALP